MSQWLLSEDITVFNDIYKLDVAYIHRVGTGTDKARLQLFSFQLQPVGRSWPALTLSVAQDER